ncbi:MAG: FAD-binding oxidoreductase [Leptolyngbyaceae cyanobacterium bins.302]|nr:FAD-binding oxidoreductase [Leptolyngbyaceae cyanobacterium bins.302]
MEVSSTIKDAIAQMIGDSNVFAKETIDENWTYQISQTVAADTAIACVAFPNTPEELAAILTYAHHQQYPVLPCGNGSKLSWGGIIQVKQKPDPSPIPYPLLVVSTSRLDRLIDHAVGDLTVTVDAGMKFAELQQILAKAGQFLAIDPTYPDQATIGGIVATADTGSLRQRYNSVRDMLLGISFVRADGQVAKAGGRVVKNVAGYDLMKLFTGSYGTLGILTQLTFRVYPLPQASQTIVLTGAAPAIAQLNQTILKSSLTPVSVDLISASVVQQLGIGAGIGLVARFQSIAASVQEQTSKVFALGQSFQVSSQTFVDEAEIAFWQRLQDCMTPATTTGAIACKIGIQPSQTIELLQADQLSHPGWYAQIHAASGLGKLFIQDACITPTALTQIRAICEENRGFLTILEAPIAFKQQIEVWGYSGNALSLMRQIKQQFDPSDRLSPHRFVGGI